MSKVLCEKSDLIAIADSVRSKTGTIDGMRVSEIPQKIEAIETGSNINLQEKTLTITSNGITTVTPDTSYDALSKVDVTVNVVGGGGGSSDEYKKSLKSIIGRTAIKPVLPDDLTTIGYSAFSGCPNLALTSLPSGVTSISDYAFNNCPNLAITRLPPGITNIGFGVFANCTGLTSITFEGNPKTIHSSAFNGCSNLTTIYVPWSQGQVANAPWGASNATIVYDYTD